MSLSKSPLICALYSSFPQGRSLVLHATDHNIHERRISRAEHKSNGTLLKIMLKDFRAQNLSNKNLNIIFLSHFPLFIHVFTNHRALEDKLQCFLIDYNTFGGLKLGEKN